MNRLVLSLIFGAIAASHVSGQETSIPYTATGLDPCTLVCCGPVVCCVYVVLQEPTPVPTQTTTPAQGAQDPAAPTQTPVEPTSVLISPAPGPTTETPAVSGPTLPAAPMVQSVPQRPVLGGNQPFRFRGGLFSRLRSRFR
jgi:hypothetical protein